MISIAQSTGDISADIYRQKSAKPVETPQLSGLEKHHQKLLAQAQAEQNPFTHGASSSARTLPDGASWLHILLCFSDSLQASFSHHRSVKKKPNRNDASSSARTLPDGMSWPRILLSVAQ